MDTNNQREAGPSGGQPAPHGRTQEQPDARKDFRNRITHIIICGSGSDPLRVKKLMKFAFRLEEKTHSHASSQSEYMQRMLNIEKSFKRIILDSAPTNSASSSNKCPNAGDSYRIQSQVQNQRQTDTNFESHQQSAPMLQQVAASRRLQYQKRKADAHEEQVQSSPSSRKPRNQAS